LHRAKSFEFDWGDPFPTVNAAKLRSIGLYSFLDKALSWVEGRSHN